VALDERRHRFRLRVFALTHELGYAPAACLVPGIRPSTYYCWRRQLLRFGPDILRPHPRHRHPRPWAPVLCAGSTPCASPLSDRRAAGV
jgi:hypothetical protein